MKLLIVAVVLPVIYIIVSQIQKNKKQAEKIQSQQQMIDQLNETAKTKEKKQQEYMKQEPQTQAKDDAYEKIRAQRREFNRQEIAGILNRNNHKNEPSNTETAEKIEQLQKDKKKPNIPWYAAGVALTRAKNEQAIKRMEERELKKAIDKINKSK